jgi:transcriptional regulator with XRE-family HTH domain
MNDAALPRLQEEPETTMGTGRGNTRAKPEEPLERRTALPAASEPANGMSLRGLRQFRGKTQVETGRAARMTQADVSLLERRRDHRISTLERYVEALGGELILIARFGEDRIRLSRGERATEPSLHSARGGGGSEPGPRLVSEDDEPSSDR